MIHIELLYTSLNSKIDSINKFILYSVQEKQPWVVLYEEKRRKWDNDMKESILLNTRSMYYPNHLIENMSNIYPNSWVDD